MTRRGYVLAPGEGEHLIRTCLRTKSAPLAPSECGTLNSRPRSMASRGPVRSRGFRSERREGFDPASLFCYNLWLSVAFKAAEIHTPPEVPTGASFYEVEERGGGPT